MDLSRAVYTKYTGQCSSKIAPECIESAIILFSFEIDQYSGSRPLVEQHWRPSGVCLAFGHSWCDKRVIGEPSNLIHHVTAERADIGR